MRRVFMIIAASLLAACGSHKALAPGLEVTLSGPANVQGFQDTISGQLVYRCNILLTATATAGSPGDAATWTGGHDHFQHQDGTSTSHPLNEQDVAGLLNENTALPAGTSVTGSDYFYTQTDRPFQLSLVFYYSTPETSNDSTSYGFSCQ
jgi:hypothetical protein